MSRRFQFSLAIVLSGIPMCFFFGWHVEGRMLGGAFAMAVYVLFAPAFLAMLSLVNRRWPDRSVNATRKSEFRWLPIYFIELAIVVFAGLFLLFCGETVAEAILGILCLLFAMLKVAAHVYICVKLPPDNAKPLESV
jgi:hypothetical protein